MPKITVEVDSEDFERGFTILLDRFKRAEIEIETARLLTKYLLTKYSSNLTEATTVLQDIVARPIEDKYALILRELRAVAAGDIPIKTFGKMLPRIIEGILEPGFKRDERLASPPTSFAPTQSSP